MNGIRETLYQDRDKRWQELSDAVAALPADSFHKQAVLALAKGYAKAHGQILLNTFIYNKAKQSEAT